MRCTMIALAFLRGARALSAVPAAARRLQRIKELESKHALLARHYQEDENRANREIPPRAGE